MTFYFGTNSGTLIAARISLILLSSWMYGKPKVNAKILAADLIKVKCQGSFGLNFSAFGHLFGPLQNGWPKFKNVKYNYLVFHNFLFIF